MKEIFWAMNEIGSRTETATTTQIKVDGQTRILKESFDAWYQSQSHYKKREDAAPQELLDATLSVGDVAKLLGIHRNSVCPMRVSVERRCLIFHNRKQERAIKDRLNRAKASF